MDYIEINRKERVKMQIIRVTNVEEGDKKALELTRESVNNDAKVLGLATGSTPETLCKEMTASNADFTGIAPVNSDEYVGLSGENE